MDFAREIQRLQSEAKILTDAMATLKTHYEKAKDFTAKFLADCGQAGITAVAIGKAHESVPSSKEFPFGSQNSVFAFQANNKEARERAGGWPPIWGVVERAGIGGGCGNTDQHQADLSNLVNGVYQLKSGKWKKIDEESE